MMSLTWHSLQKILLPQLGLTISWATDEKNSFVCARCDVRTYMHPYPTKLGVTLKKWELMQLSKIIGQYNADMFYTPGRLNETKISEKVDDLEITSSFDGISLKKNSKYCLIPHDHFKKVRAFIPGIIYIMDLLKLKQPTERSWLLVDAFILSFLSDWNDESYQEEWEIDELLRTGKLEHPERRELLEANPTKIWDVFYDKIVEPLASVYPIRIGEFITRINGDFAPGLKQHFKDNGVLLKSLALVLKRIAPIEGKPIFYKKYEKK